MNRSRIRQQLIALLDTEAITEARLETLVQLVSLIDQTAYEEGFTDGYQQGSDTEKPQ